MRRRGRWVAILLLLAALVPSPSPAFDLAAQTALRWLSDVQAEDGSWGAASGIAPLYTAHVVRALEDLGLRGAAYGSGITWLSNHAMANVDQRARRVLSDLDGSHAFVAGHAGSGSLASPGLQIRGDFFSAGAGCVNAHQEPAPASSLRSFDNEDFTDRNPIAIVGSDRIRTPDRRRKRPSRSWGPM